MKAFFYKDMQDIIPLLIKRDSKFGLIVEQYGIPNLVTRPQGFESMCKTILEQQVSLDSARASFNKLKSLIVDFTPRQILKCTDEEMRQCGISRQKIMYLRGLTEAVMQGIIDFDSFPNKDHQLIRDELIRIKGIGNWTIDVYLMFSLQSPDILPLGDIGIISAIKDIWGFESQDDIIAHTKTWAPYRTTAAFFLWHYYLAKRGRKFPH